MIGKVFGSVERYVLIIHMDSESVSIWVVKEV